MIDDDSHRIHLAANDPAFPAQREAAVAMICAAIDTVVLSFGYTRKGTTWSRTSAQGRTIVNLQRNQYGWHADISLRFILPDGTAASTGAWEGSDELTLGQFQTSIGPDAGRIAYLDVTTNSTALDLPIDILRTQALPWLDAHHASPQ